MTPRQLHNAVRSLLFTRRTAERLSEVETSLKIYLVQQPAPCVTVGEHQIALVGDRLEVSLHRDGFIIGPTGAPDFILGSGGIDDGLDLAPCIGPAETITGPDGLDIQGGHQGRNRECQKEDQSPES